MADRPPRSADGARAPDADLERLRHLAFVVLSPALGTLRRASIADDLARSNLAAEAGYEAARDHLVQQVLHTGHRPRRLSALALRPAQPAGDPATQALAAMMPAARAAYVLIRLEQVSPERAEAVLGEAGVRDPRSAVGLAERSELAAADVRALTVPVAAGGSRARLVLAVAAVLVIAVAAPVIAVAASGGGDTPSPVSNQTPPGADPTDPTDPTDPAESVKAVQLDRDLARVLRRLDQELSRQGPDRDEITRLRTLRAAVLAEQERLRSN